MVLGALPAFFATQGKTFKQSENIACYSPANDSTVTSFHHGAVRGINVMVSERFPSPQWKNSVSEDLEPKPAVGSYFCCFLVKN